MEHVTAGGGLPAGGQTAFEDYVFALSKHEGQTEPNLPSLLLGSAMHWLSQ